MQEEAVKQFIEQNLAPEGRFRSLSQWAMASELTVSTLHGVRRTGRADPETLVKIGRPLNLSPVDMFVLAGWLDDSQELAEGEREWLGILRSTPEAMRPVLLEGIRCFAESLGRHIYNVNSPSLPRVAEPRDRDYKA